MNYVLGAGNSFLGGLAAGLSITGNIYEGMWLETADLKNTLLISLSGAACFYASVSAAFIIEQSGLPPIGGKDDSGKERWNDDVPYRRLDDLRSRHSG